MLHSDPLFDAAANPWLSCAVLFTARIVIPGIAWHWICPAAPEQGQRRWPAALIAAGHTVVLGALIALLTALALAAADRYTLRAEGLVLALIAAAGIVAGLKRKGLADRARARGATLAALAVFLTVAAVMLVPRRGEWILGGWDPGIYVNRGVIVNRTGTLQTPPDPFFAQFTEEELPYLTRPMLSYTEAYPVIPLDRETRALQPLLFHLTSVGMALADRCGGLRAATRFDGFFGLLTILVFAAAVQRLYPGAARALVAAGALLLHPLWLYHTHFPNAEILQVFLLSGVALWLPDRHRWPTGPLVLGLLLFAGMVNRFTLLPFAGLLLCLLAVLDLARSDRRKVAWERSVQLAALGLGALYDYHMAATSLGRIYEAVPKLLGGFGLLALAAVALDAWGTAVAEAGKRLHAFFDRWAWPLALAGFALLVLAAYALSWPPLVTVKVVASRAAPFLGAGFIAAALGGGIALAGAARQAPTAIKAWCIFLLAATALTLASPEIAPILPWATRRYLEYTVPLLALLIGALIEGLWTHRTRLSFLGRSAAIIALATLLILTARASRRAWAYTEYDGLSAILTEAAQRIGPGDIVVADHFRWGTPLRFIYGQQVVNGELYLGAANAARFRGALQALERRRQPGTRILFFTSTEAGMAVFPSAVEPVALLWESLPWLMREVNHSRRATQFELKSKPKVFRLYAWQER